MLLQRVVFLAACVLLPNHGTECNVRDQIMGPWFIQCLMFAFIHGPFVCNSYLHERARRDVLKLAMHITCVAVLTKACPSMAWACSTHAILHVTNPYTIPFALATITACMDDHSPPRAPMTLAYALIWPDIIDLMVNECVRLV